MAKSRRPFAEMFFAFLLLGAAEYLLQFLFHKSVPLGVYGYNAVAFLINFGFGLCIARPFLPAEKAESGRNRALLFTLFLPALILALYCMLFVFKVKFFKIGDYYQAADYLGGFYQNDYETVSNHLAYLLAGFLCPFAFRGFHPVNRDEEKREFRFFLAFLAAFAGLIYLVFRAVGAAGNFASTGMGGAMQGPVHSALTLYAYEGVVFLANAVFGALLGGFLLTKNREASFSLWRLIRLGVPAFLAGLLPMAAVWLLYDSGLYVMTGHHLMSPDWYAGSSSYKLFLMIQFFIYYDFAQIFQLLFGLLLAFFALPVLTQRKKKRRTKNPERGNTYET